MNNIETLIKVLKESNNSTKLTLQEALGNLSQLPGLHKNGWDKYIFGKNGNYTSITPQSKVEKVLTLDKFDIDPLVNLVRKGKYEMLIVYINSVANDQPALAIQDYGNNNQVSYIMLVNSESSTNINNTRITIPTQKIRDRGGKGERYQFPKRSKNLKDIFYIPNIKEATKIEVYAIQADENKRELTKNRNRYTNNIYHNREEFNKKGGTKLKPLLDKNKQRAKEKLEKFVNILPEKLQIMVKQDLEKGNLDYKTINAINAYFDNLKKSFENLKQISNYGTMGYTYDTTTMLNKDEVKKIIATKNYLDTI